MTLPTATTFITVLRSPTDATTDPLDPPAAAQEVMSGVRAVISAPRGSERVEGSSQEVIQWRLNSDTVDIKHTDQVRDEKTGELYEVVWASLLGKGQDLEHIEAGLKQVSGLVP